MFCLHHRQALDRLRWSGTVAVRPKYSEAPLPKTWTYPHRLHHGHVLDVRKENGSRPRFHCARQRSARMTDFCLHLKDGLLRLRPLQ